MSNGRCAPCNRRAVKLSVATRELRKAMIAKPCAICSTPMAQPCYDEDQNTGQLRGWLCHNCNKGIGMFRDSAGLLIAAANYLKGLG